MRFKVKPLPKRGAYKFVKVFAFLPHRIGNYVYWLTFIKRTYVYKDRWEKRDLIV